MHGHIPWRRQSGGWAGLGVCAIALLLIACHAPPPTSSKPKAEKAEKEEKASEDNAKPSKGHWDKKKGYALSLPKGDWNFLAQDRLSAHGPEVVAAWVGGDDCFATLKMVPASVDERLKEVVNKRLETYFPDVAPEYLEPLQFGGHGAMQAELNRVEGGVPTRYRITTLLGWHRGTHHLYEVRVQSHSELFVQARRCFDMATAALDIAVDGEGKPLPVKSK